MQCPCKKRNTASHDSASRSPAHGDLREEALAQVGRVAATLQPEEADLGEQVVGEGQPAQPAAVYVEEGRRPQSGRELDEEVALRDGRSELL